MSIVIRRPWTRQPQTVAQLNQDLVSSFGLQDVFLRGRSIVGGVVLPGALGVNVNGVGPNHEAPTTYLNAKVQFDPSAWSVILSATFVTLGGYSYYIYSSSTNLRAISLADSDFSPARLQIYAGAKYFSPSLYVSAGETATIGFGWDGAKLYFAKNGIIESVNGATMGAQDGWGFKGIAGNLPTVRATHIAFFKRCLTESKFAELTLNPNLLFAPQTRRIWVPSAAAGVPTLSASTYVPGSLTSTGWRPQVTAS